MLGELLQNIDDMCLSTSSPKSSFFHDVGSAAPKTCRPSTVSEDFDEPSLLDPPTDVGLGLTKDLMEVLTLRVDSLWNPLPGTSGSAAEDLSLVALDDVVSEMGGLRIESKKADDDAGTLASVGTLGPDT